MAWDISWLWNTLQSIGSAISNFFSSVWGVVQQITNTGQGIFQGLVAVGSAIWDALLKGLSTLGSWISSAFSWIYNGLKYVSDVLGQWISTAFNWIGSGLNWIAQQLYNFGQWLWNGLCWIWDVIRNAFISFGNWLMGIFSGLASAIGNWWSGVISGVNSWFTNILKVFRQKIVQTLMADIGIAGMWKSGEKIIGASSLKDIGFGLLGLGLSPLVGYAIGKFVDCLLPMPSTEPYPLIPTISGFAYTPPSLDITRPSAPTPPYIGVPPTAPYVGLGLPYDVTLTILKAPTIDYTTTTTDKALVMPSLAIDQTTDSADNTLAMPSLNWAILYENYNVGDDLNVYAYGLWIAGQTFTVGKSGHYVSALRLKLYRIGNPPQVKIGIKAVSNGVPSGDYLTSVTIDGSKIPTSASWIEITLPPCYLNANTMYAIVIEVPNGDENNCVYWRTDSTSPTYADGYRVWSNDGGSTWNIDTSCDNMFEVWGYP